MAMSEGLLRVARSYVGTESPTDVELNARFDETGSARTTVEQILRQRRADFVADPASYTIGGKYTQNAASNIIALERDLDRLLMLPDDLGVDPVTGEVTPPAMRVQAMRRVGPRR